ncbi:hypothetical protein WICMUC_002822 [Wickerhamomyces mucosus]|uniref:Rab-GAP TBC domain-containing protein n=1 Tax=Wickerhamomyces mucosus TaxID=1378264 RepID=A0A9P8TDI8_9ASCO|nr:hypothetical protein WICMUC_002822 [Wickerhamomyces mucosus]
MDPETFTQLLLLESNLSKASLIVENDSTLDQTSLLLSHLDTVSNLNISYSSSSSIDNNISQLSIDDIQELFKRDGNFNLCLRCSTCNDLIFLNDEFAFINEPKPNLNKCCQNSYNIHINLQLDSIELSYWWFFINNFSSCILSLPNYTRFMIIKGIPMSLRERIWGIITKTTNPQGELIDNNYYKKLYESLNKDISPDIRIINNDVNRTFPELSIFNEYSQRLKFARILNAFSIYDSDMGYCQGLQFLVAPLLFHYNDEFKTFITLINLFKINELRYIYDNQMSGLNLWFYQFNEIFELENLELFNHFQNLNIDINIFLSQWFLSIFAITIPFTFLIRIFDILLMEGFKSTIFRIGLIILNSNNKILLNIDDDELIYKHLLSNMCWGVFANDDDYFMNLFKVQKIQNFTPQSLKLLEIKFNRETQNLNESNKPIFKKILKNLSNHTELFYTSLISSTSSINTNFQSSELSLKSTNSSSISLSSTSNDFDLELIEGLYNLCMDNKIKDPLLVKVKERLGI